MTPDEPLQNDRSPYADMMMLILSETPSDIEAREKIAGVSQSAAVDWLVDLQEIGGEDLVREVPADPAERLQAFRAAWYDRHHEDYLWVLIFTDDPEKISHLESKLDVTQQAAVDYFIEGVWSENLPHLVGRRGSQEGRRDALRHIWEAEIDPYMWPEDPCDMMLRTFR